MAVTHRKPSADDAIVRRTAQALAARNMHATVAESAHDALEQLTQMLPEGAELFDSTSETLDAIGFSAFVRNNPRYRNLRDAFIAETDPQKQRELRRLSTVAEYFIGSVHAIAETGEIVVASGSGSQIAAYVYSAKYVILVAGTQKICSTLPDAIDRVRGHSLERHDQWLSQQGRGPSPIGKLAILENEVVEGRVRIILVKDNLGW